MKKNLENLEAAIAVRDMILNATLTQMLSVAANLNIADLLKDGEEKDKR